MFVDSYGKNNRQRGETRHRSADPIGMCVISFEFEPMWTADICETQSVLILKCHCFVDAAIAHPQSISLNVSFFMYCPDASNIAQCVTMSSVTLHSSSLSHVS